MVVVYGWQGSASASGLVNTAQFVRAASLAGAAGGDTVPAKKGFLTSPAVLNGTSKAKDSISSLAGFP